METRRVSYGGEDYLVFVPPEKRIVYDQDKKLQREELVRSVGFPAPAHKHLNVLGEEQEMREHEIWLENRIAPYLLPLAPLCNIINREPEDPFYLLPAAKPFSEKNKGQIMLIEKGGLQSEPSVRLFEKAADLMNRGGYNVCWYNLLGNNSISDPHAVLVDGEEVEQRSDLTRYPISALPQVLAEVWRRRAVVNFGINADYTFCVAQHLFPFDLMQLEPSKTVPLHLQRFYASTNGLPLHLDVDSLSDDQRADLDKIHNVGMAGLESISRVVVNRPGLCMSDEELIEFVNSHRTNFYMEVQQAQPAELELVGV